MFPMGFILNFRGRGEGGRKRKIFFIFFLVPIGSQCVPHGFILSFGGGGRGWGKRKIFFIFLLFQQVPNVFPMGVPNRTLL